MEGLLKFKICYRTSRNLITFQSLVDRQANFQDKRVKYHLSILIHNLSANDGYILWPTDKANLNRQLIQTNREENSTSNCDAYKSEKNIKNCINRRKGQSSFTQKIEHLNNYCSAVRQTQSPEIRHLNRNFKSKLGIQCPY